MCCPGRALETAAAAGKASTTARLLIYTGPQALQTKVHAPLPEVPKGDGQGVQGRQTLGVEKIRNLSLNLVGVWEGPGQGGPGVTGFRWLLAFLLSRPRTASSRDGVTP